MTPCESVVKKIMGEPYAGNPQVRFEEEGGNPTFTLRYVDGMSLYRGYFVVFGVDFSGLDFVISGATLVEGKGVQPAEATPAQKDSVNKLLDKLKESKSEIGEYTRSIALDKTITVTIFVGKGLPNATITSPDGKKGISIDPDNTKPFEDGTPRDPASELGHEIAHTKRDIDGKNKYENAIKKLKEDKTKTKEEKKSELKKAFNEEEVDVSNLENKYRKEQGLTQRKFYGTPDLPCIQY